MRKLGQLDRRLFLAGSAASLALSGRAFGQRRGGRAIIVGAGVAGLACAADIQRAGMDVTVLEARAEIGGRARTSRAWVDRPVELGASWVHGLDNNPVRDLAVQSGLALSATDYDNRQIYGESGGLLDRRALNRLDEMETRLTRFAANAPGNRLESECRIRPRGVLDNRLFRLMRLDAFSEAKRRRGLFLLNTELEHEFGTDYENLSRCFWTEGEELSGGDAMLLGGIDRMMQHMAHGLDVRLSQTVLGIDHDRDGVLVTTSSGTERADAVVVTVPLGVLRENIIRFTPDLPDTKQQAIQDLGVGVLNKCILRFGEQAWPNDPEMFNRLTADRGAWAEWVNLSAYGQGLILMGFNAGSYARYLEQFDDEETVALAMEALRGMFGSSLPDPVATQITRWSRDPHAYGSYSFPAENTQWDSRIRLLEPVDQRVFFAGEATSTRAPGTLHGALQSGRAAANAVVER